MNVVLPPCDADDAQIVDLVPALRDSLEVEVAELQAEADRTFREADEAFGAADDLEDRARTLRAAAAENYRTAGAIQFRVDELRKRLGER